VWIATHSINLLAHYWQPALWFVRDGEVRREGPGSAEVLAALLGNESGLEELSTFIALPDQCAALVFAAQCLSPPGVADTPPGDPQTTQICEAVSSLAAERGDLRIVDFGMGKGRLLGELKVAFPGLDGRIDKRLDYFGFDPHQDEVDRETSLSRLAETYDDPEKRLLRSLDELESLNPGSVNVIVMCNTLHEIPPEDWFNYIGANGLLTKLLKEDGQLLVVEDQIIPVGERAHRFGCLVLDAPELRMLFNIEPESDQLITTAHASPRYRDRLKAHLVPRDLLERANAESRKNALRSLRDRSLRRVKEFQGAASTIRAGRTYAFWAHQHVNATLALNTIYGDS
jgi:broad specificity phosphatase PhoE